MENFWSDRILKAIEVGSDHFTDADRTVRREAGVRREAYRKGIALKSDWANLKSNSAEIGKKLVRRRKGIVSLDRNG